MTVETRATTVVPGTVVPLWPNGAPGSEGHDLGRDRRGAERDARLDVGAQRAQPVADALPGRRARRDRAGGHRRAGRRSPDPRDRARGLPRRRLPELGRDLGVPAQVPPRARGGLARTSSRCTPSPTPSARSGRSGTTRRPGASTPHRVVMIGFSAGAGLTLLAGAIYDAGDPSAADPIERAELAARRAGADLRRRPPGRLGHLHCRDAAGVPARRRRRSARQRVLPAALRAHEAGGVPIELHVYASGGHGFGIKANPKPVPSATTWQLRFVDWLRDRRLLEA